MQITDKIKDLIKRIESNEVDRSELIKILKRIDKVPEFKNHAAFFGSGIRLSRLQDKNIDSDIHDTRDFLLSAFRVYFDLK